MPGAPHHRGRHRRAREHAAEIGGAEQAYGQLAKSVERAAHRHDHPNQSIAADQKEHGNENGGDGGKLRQRATQAKDVMRAMGANAALRYRLPAEAPI